MKRFAILVGKTLDKTKSDKVRSSCCNQNHYGGDYEFWNHEMQGSLILSLTTDNIVYKSQNLKIKGSHLEKKKAKIFWDWNEELKLGPNVLVIKLGDLSQNGRIENFDLGLLTD